MLKQIKWTAVLLAIAEIAAGVLLIMFPALSSDVICYMVGVGACIFGVISLTQYFLLRLEDSLFRNEFVIGIMALLIGILIMVKKALIIDLVPVVLGILIVLSGFLKLQRAVVAMRIHYDKAYWYAIMGAVAIILGLVIMFVLSPVKTQEIIFRTIGGGLVYCGISDLVTVFLLAGKFHKFVNDFKNGNIAVTVSAPPAAETVIDAEPVQPDETPEQTETE
jgi:uncharacterized membrane protein HdeD (DUF308 family)